MGLEDLGIAADTPAVVSPADRRVASEGTSLGIVAVLTSGTLGCLLGVTLADHRVSSEGTSLSFVAILAGAALRTALGGFLGGASPDALSHGRAASEGASFSVVAVLSGALAGLLGISGLDRGIFYKRHILRRKATVRRVSDVPSWIASLNLAAGGRDECCINRNQLSGCDESAKSGDPPDESCERKVGSIDGCRMD